MSDHNLAAFVDAARAVDFLGSGAYPARASCMSNLGLQLRFVKAFGERVAASYPDSQANKIQIHVALVNRFLALGTAKIVRVARFWRRWRL